MKCKHPQSTAAREIIIFLNEWGFLFRVKMNRGCCVEYRRVSFKFKLAYQFTLLDFIIPRHKCVCWRNERKQDETRS